MSAHLATCELHGLRVREGGGWGGSDVEGWEERGMRRGWGGERSGGMGGYEEGNREE